MFGGETWESGEDRHARTRRGRALEILVSESRLPIRVSAARSAHLLFFGGEWTVVLCPPDLLYHGVVAHTHEFTPVSVGITTWQRLHFMHLTVLYLSEADRLDGEVACTASRQAQDMKTGAAQLTFPKTPEQ